MHLWKKYNQLCVLSVAGDDMNVLVDNKVRGSRGGAARDSARSYTIIRRRPGKWDRHRVVNDGKGAEESGQASEGRNHVGR